MKKDAYRQTCAVRPALSTLFLARKEHIHGKKIYSAKAQFCGNGQCHDIVIECDSVGLKDPCLEIRIDKRPVMQVKRLAWKFRGNHTIMVDGLPVEVFWDVHSWLFSSTTSNAVFMFQTCPAPEKSIPWMYSQIFRESQSQCLGFSLILLARHDNLNMSQEIDHHKHNQILKLISSIGNIVICVDAIHLILYR
ncbi:hypothetical protein ACQ4PT_028367 [Festuca glaucescens]